MYSAFGPHESQSEFIYSLWQFPGNVILFTAAHAKRMFDVLITVTPIDTWSEEKFITDVLNNQGHTNRM